MVLEGKRKIFSYTYIHIILKRILSLVGLRWKGAAESEDSIEECRRGFRRRTFRFGNCHRFPRRAIHILVAYYMYVTIYYIFIDLVCGWSFRFCTGHSATLSERTGCSGCCGFRDVVLP